MNIFESLLDYQKFSFLIKDKRRDPNESWCQNFLECLLASCERRTASLPNKTELWRAQLGRDKTIYQIAGGSVLDTALKPFQPHRMKPQPQMVKDGRANPSGIAMLYLSRDQDTAMAECRPWMATHISIGKFYTTQNLKIMDLSRDEIITFGLDDYEKELDQNFAEKVIWGEINKAFMKPIQRTDDLEDYLPTQKIAEFFKQQGFEGLKYNSALGEGYNMVLFDPSVAVQAEGSLFSVKDIHYSFAAIKGSSFKT